MRIGKPAVLLLLGLLAWAAPGQSEPEDKYEIARGNHPAIAADRSGRMHVAFEACTTEGKVPDIFYKVNAERGGWSPAKDISNTSGVSQSVDIAVEKNGAVDLVWVDDSSDTRSADVYFARSADGGKTWTRPIDISSTPGRSAEPAITTGADDSIHIAWSDTSKGEKNQDIYYTSTQDQGKTWSAAIDISNTAGASHFPTITVAPGGTIHAAWTEKTTGAKNSDIFYSQAKNGVWAKPSNISGNNHICSHPAIACNKEKVFLVWSELATKDNAADICLEVGSDSGSFGAVINLTRKKGRSTEPVLCILGDELAIIWSNTAGGSNAPSIKGVAIADNGLGSARYLHISNAHGPARHPDLTTYGGKLFAAWEEGARANAAAAIEMRAIDLKEAAAGHPLMVDPKDH